MSTPRKYFRIIYNRTSRFSGIVSHQEEDVYAYTIEGARRTFERYHQNDWGFNSIKDVREIDKNEFRGHHIIYSNGVFAHNK